MPFGDKLQTLIDERGINVSELSRITDINRNTLYSYIRRNTQKVDPAVIGIVAEALNVDVHYFLDEQAPAVRPLPADLRPVSDLHRQRVPMIGKVAAGQPIMADMDYETFVDAPLDCDAALEVKGDSMAPTYLDGDILYIKHRPDVPDGQVAVVLLNDEATLKHVYHDPDGLTLLSDNHDYAPIRAHADTYDYIAIYGVPVGYTRIYKKPSKKARKGMKQQNGG